MANSSTLTEILLLENDEFYSVKYLLKKLNYSDKVVLIEKFIDMLLLYCDMDIFTNEKSSLLLLKSSVYLNRFLKEDSKFNRIEIYEKIDLLLTNLNKIIDDKDMFMENSIYSNSLLSLITKLDIISKNNPYLYNDNIKDDKYDLLNHLIFELKDKTCIPNLFKAYPDIIYSQDENHKSLLTKLASNYAKAVNDLELNDISYYNFVFENLLEVNPLMESKENLIEILNNIKPKFSSTRDDIIKRDWIDKLNNSFGSKINSESVDELLERYGIISSFDLEKDEEVSSLINRYNNIIASKTRQRLDYYMVSIDPKNTETIDDALSVKKLDNGNYLLGVHIAAVTDLITPFSNTFKSSREKTTSIWFNDLMIPMLPDYLSNDLLSLTSSKPKLATSYFLEIDNLGNIVNYEFLKTIIKVDENITSTKANEILEKGMISDQLSKTIIDLKIVTNLLNKNYKENEFYKLLKEGTESISNNRVGNTQADRIIETCMRSVGSTIGKHFKANGLPLLYRTLSLSKEDNNRELLLLIGNLEEAKDRRRISNIVMRDFSKAISSKYANSGRHDGLNLDSYCHATSPLRRYADIVVEQCLNTCYFNTPSDRDVYLLEDYVKREASNINSKNQSIRNLFLEYSEQKVKKHVL